MKCNVGGTDRILRISVGALLVAFAASNIIGWWGWLGLIPMATGLFRFLLNILDKYMNKANLAKSLVCMVKLIMGNLIHLLPSLILAPKNKV